MAQRLIVWKAGRCRSIVITVVAAQQEEGKGGGLGGRERWGGRVKGREGEGERRSEVSKEVIIVETPEIVGDTSWFFSENQRDRPGYVFLKINNL
jgi:hypothetical protein